MFYYNFQQISVILRLPKYRLKDFHDEEIKGTFYQSELQKVDVRDDDIWNIEKILKTKGKGNNK
jgi:hypothetical protein